jgi:archaellum component FlaC
MAGLLDDLTACVGILKEQARALRMRSTQQETTLKGLEQKLHEAEKTIEALRLDAGTFASQTLETVRLVRELSEACEELSNRVIALDEKTA